SGSCRRFTPLQAQATTSISTGFPAGMPGAATSRKSFSAAILGWETPRVRSGEDFAQRFQRGFAALIYRHGVDALDDAGQAFRREQWAELVAQAIDADRRAGHDDCGDL